ncbi:MAG: hypothetical protein RBS39_11470 [Phycisphaerales bacterium]|jgi:DNA-binding NarL/FixJ family response regulator|nr:hypothetical protein [Phycisphaerales bacterium]
MILYCASDLLWASKIKGTGDALGIPCRPVRNADMLAARLADSDVRALIVDLEAGDAALALIVQIRAHGPESPASDRPPARVIAFGPHVDKDRLQAARDAGADAVYTRGAFADRLPDLLTALESGARV